jgi:uncharacterized delta-60 repeat protein
VSRRCVASFVALGLLLLLLPGTGYAHDPGVGLVRYNPDGSPDPSFGRAGIVAERTPQGGLDPAALAIQADGKIVLAGTTSDLATATVGFGLARYNPDGTLDMQFGTAGRTLTLVGAGEAAGHAMVLQPDGKIIVAGSGFLKLNADGQSGFAVARYLPDGTLDDSFGTGGTLITSIGDSGAEARALALQADGGIVLAGTAFATASHDDAFAVVRYTSDGALDQQFGTVVTPFAAADGEPSPARAAAILLQPDGAITVAGSVGGHQGTFGMARYTSRGLPDPGFGTGGTTTTLLAASAQAYALAGEPDGHVLVAGGLGPPDSLAFVVARYGRDGSLDPGFGTQGVAITNFPNGGSGAHAVLVQPDGKIVALGSGNGGFCVARYAPDGRPDPSFGTAGTVVTMVSDAGSQPAALGLEPDGKLVAAGLTYFLVPTPSSDPPWVPLAAAGSVAMLAALGSVWLVRRRRARGSLARR